MPFVDFATVVSWGVMQDERSLRRGLQLLNDQGNQHIYEREERGGEERFDLSSACTNPSTRPSDLAGVWC
jgi:hypothetical protein